VKKREIGRSGIYATALGVGTWAIGGTEWGGADRAASVAAIRAALDAGIDLIDTAPIYGYGLSEEVVGEAIRGRRDEVVLATKCGLVWSGEEGQYFFTNERGDVRRHLGAAAIKRQLDESLRRLGVDHIDLYQTHWQDSTTPIGETMGALLDLKRAGKIRAIGVSNVTPEQLSAYASFGEIASAQEQFNMIDRRHEAGLFPLCASLGAGVLAYSPLAMGLLSGKMSAGRRFAEGDARGGSARFAPDVIASIDRFLSSLQPIASAHGASLAQLVLAWTLARPSVTHVLSGMRDPAQAAENAAAAEIVLGAGDIAAIDLALAEADPKAPQLYG
jgi:aryl-alcohol dehydrogenase-like predicted oxidoreductase